MQNELAPPLRGLYSCRCPLHFSTALRMKRGGYHISNYAVILHPRLYSEDA